MSGKSYKKKLAIALAFMTVFIAVPSMVNAIPITVPGISDLWLAGMPDGSTASSGDVAPDHSPVEVLGLDLSLGGLLTFTNAQGGVSNGPGCPPGCSPIDGGSLFNHFAGAENGISDLVAPINSLIGVFLTDEQPDSTPAPERLDFGDIGLDFNSVAPLINQAFFIGDGVTSDDVVQEFVIPDDATRFYLGTMDGFGWFNNSGAITIEVSQVQSPTTPVSEPSTTLLMSLGLFAFGVLRLSRTRTLNK